MSKKRKKAEKPTSILVYILHQHGNDIPTTVGHIMVASEEDVPAKAKEVELWITRKKALLDCKRYGDECYAEIHDANKGGRRTVSLGARAEEIVPTTEKESE